MSECERQPSIKRGVVEIAAGIGAIATGLFGGITMTAIEVQNSISFDPTGNINHIQIFPNHAKEILAVSILAVTAGAISWLHGVNEIDSAANSDHSE